MSRPRGKKVTVSAPKKRKKPAGKRGPRGNFKGSRLEFLQSHIPAYLAAGARGDYKPFWDAFFPAWWKKYPAWIPDNVEPTEDSVAEPPEDFDDEQRQSDRKSTRLNSSHSGESRMPSSA